MHAQLCLLAKYCVSALGLVSVCTAIISKGTPYRLLALTPYGDLVGPISMHELLNPT